MNLIHGDGDNTTQRTEDGFVEVVSGSLVTLSEDGKPLGEPVPVGTEPCNVGRGAHCHVSVRDGHMSTSHCEITATAAGMCVTDTESLNGTWVNGVRLKPGHSVYLTVSGRLRCGHTWFDVRVTGHEQVPLSGAVTFGPLVGGSVVMRELYTKLARIAPTDLSVLITGETGTGKELVAQAIHDASRRRDGPFVLVNCTTINSALAESTLFGHERGAFTGAVGKVPSPFLEAQGGTIFFDELGELPPDIQPKLLRALEAREIQAVGSSRLQPIDVRVIAATRRDLRKETNIKNFRDDLYFRFAQAVIETPPLRAHREDIPDLVANILAKSTEPGDLSALSRIDKPAMERLMRHDWPGNVRELRNVLYSALAHSQGGPIDFSDALDAQGIRLSDPTSAAQSFAVLMNDVAREYWTKLSLNTGANVSEMARRSGLARSTVREYLQKFDLREAKST